METGAPFRSIQRENRYSIVEMIIRLLIGAIFIYAGVLKVADPAAFAWTIYQYGPVPRDLINVTAIGLPVIEVLSGVGLIFNVRGSVVVIAGLLAMFLIVLGYVLLSGLNVDCGCFSAGEPGAEGLRKALTRDVIMMVGIWYVYWVNKGRKAEHERIEQVK